MRNGASGMRRAYPGRGGACKSCKSSTGAWYPLAPAMLDGDRREQTFEARVTAYVGRCAEHFGSARDISDALYRVGVRAFRGGDAPIPTRTVQAWISGETQPSAVVLFALGMIARESLDVAAGLQPHEEEGPEALISLAGVLLARAGAMLAGGAPASDRPTPDSG